LQLPAGAARRGIADFHDATDAKSAPRELFGEIGQQPLNLRARGAL
jgi:hypothetical protein